MPIGYQPEITDLDVNKRQCGAPKILGWRPDFFFPNVSHVRLLWVLDDDFLKVNPFLSDVFVNDDASSSFR